MTSNPYEDLDDYDLHSLATHLYEASMFIELVENIIKQNMFIQTRYSREGSYAGYLRDLELVWRWADSDQAWHVSHQIRCALIRSSIYALTANMPPALLAQLVQSGLWSATGAVEFIAQIQNEEQRAEAILAIAPVLPDLLDLKERLLFISQEITSEYYRGNILGKLVQYLPDILKDQALTTIYDINGSITRTLALCDAISFLPAYLIEKMLEIVETVSAAECPLVVRVLAPRLLRTPRRSDDNQPSKVLKQHIKVLKIIKNSTTHLWRVWALGLLLPCLSISLKKAALREITRTVQNDPRLQSDSIIFVDSTSGIVKEAQWDMRLWSDETRALAIAFLVAQIPNLRSDEQAHMLTKILRILHDTRGSIWPPLLHIFIDMLPHLSESLRIEAITAVLTNFEVDLELLGSRSLIELSKHTPEALKVNLIKLAIKTITKHGTDRREQVCTWILNSLLPYQFRHLDTNAINSILALTEASNDIYIQLRIYCELLAYLPDELSNRKEQITQIVRVTLKKDFENRDEQVKAWSRLVPYLPKDEKIAKLKELWADSLKIGDEFGQTTALCQLAPHLPTGKKEQALQEALKLVMDWQSFPGITTPSLIKLAPNLPQDLQRQALQQALANIKRIYEPEANLLIELALYLPDNLKIQPLNRILVLNDSRVQVKALSKVMPHVPDDVKWRALEEAITQRETLMRARALSALAPYLSYTEKNVALQQMILAKSNPASVSSSHTLTQAIQEKLKAWTLTITRRPGENSMLANTPITGLEPYELQEELAASRTLENDLEQVVVSSGLAEYLSEAPKNIVLQEALVMVQGIFDDVKLKIPFILETNSSHPYNLYFKARIACIDSLIDVATYLPDLLKTKELQDILTNDEWQALIEWAAARDEDNGTKRFESLIGLLPILPDAVKGKALIDIFYASKYLDGSTICFQLNKFDIWAEHIYHSLGTQRLEQALTTAIKSRGQINKFPKMQFQQQENQVDKLQRILEDELSPAGGYMPAVLWSALAWYLPVPLKTDALRVALLATTKSELDIKHEETRADGRTLLLERIVALWQALDFAGLDNEHEKRNLWREILQTLAQRRRPQFLYDLGALASLITHYDGADVVNESFQAIKDVTQWWP